MFLTANDFHYNEYLCMKCILQLLNKCAVYWSYMRIFYFMDLSKVPQSTYRAPVEEDVIAKIREENRKRAEVSVWHTNSLYSLHTHSVRCMCYFTLENYLMNSLMDFLHNCMWRKWLHLKQTLFFSPVVCLVFCFVNRKNL